MIIRYIVIITMVNKIQRNNHQMLIRIMRIWRLDLIGLDSLPVII